MKRTHRLVGFILSLIAGLIGWSGKAFAPPTTVTVSAGPNFGTIYASGGASGTVILSPTGTISTTGGAAAFGGAPAKGLAFCKGNNTHMGSVTGTWTVKNTTGSTMTVKTFKFQENGGSFLGTTSFTFIPQGNTKIDIGATLHVKAGQPAGTYTGTFTMNWNKL